METGREITVGNVTHWWFHTIQITAFLKSSIHLAGGMHGSLWYAVPASVPPCVTQGETPETPSATPLSSHSGADTSLTSLRPRPPWHPLWHSLRSVFRNVLLSHHDYFRRPQRWLTRFSGVFFPVNKVKILSFCLQNLKSTLETHVILN